jgi:isopenicillin-N epimerase
LLAPIGAGFLALGPNVTDLLEPLQVSWGYRYDRALADEPDNAGSTPRLKALEFEGTRDPCPWMAVSDAIDFQAEIGWGAIQRRMRTLAALVRQRFEGLAGLRLATPTDPALHGAMTAFWWPSDLVAKALWRGLRDRKIEALVGEWPEGLTLRVSTHFYNTEAELERLAEAVPALAGRS